MSAWYKQNISAFLRNDVESIVERLSAAASDQNLPTNRETMGSWRRTVEIMRKAANYWNFNIAGANDWTVLFEY